MYSIVIPTYNGAKKLPTLLTALEKQENKEFEVIVIIDGSTDDSLEVLKNINWQLNLVIAMQKNKGRSAARNKGVSLAKNDQIIFFDDDMRPLPSCTARHLEHHAQYPGSILTGGATEETNASSPEILKFKSFLSAKWVHKVKILGTQPMGRNNILVTTQNFSLSKKLFNELGGFDERLSDGEDFDLAVKAFKANIPLYYNYQAFAWHDDPLTAVSYIRRQRQYTRSQLNLLTLHPEYITDGFLQQPYMPTGLKKVIFRIFCYRFWIIVIEKNRIAWLPEKIKYKLYDYIIMANGVFFPQLVPLDRFESLVLGKIAT